MPVSPPPPPPFHLCKEALPIKKSLDLNACTSHDQEAHSRNVPVQIGIAQKNPNPMNEGQGIKKKEKGREIDAGLAKHLKERFKQTP